MSRVLQMHEPLRGLRLLKYGEPPLALEEVEAREAVAFQRGKDESEGFYTMQIAQMRQEMAELQEGLFAQLEARMGELEDVVNTRLPGLVMELVRRVCAGHAPDAEEIRDVIQEAVREASPDGARCEVRLHPEDLALLRKYAPEMATDKLSLLEDAGLSRGDCLAQSRFGLVDARRQTKLQQLDDELGGGE